MASTPFAVLLTLMSLAASVLAVLLAVPMFGLPGIESKLSAYFPHLLAAAFVLGVTAVPLAWRGLRKGPRAAAVAAALLPPALVIAFFLYLIFGLRGAI